MCHGDYRADNLMFDDAASGREHVGILDWQIVYRAGGIGDISYLLTQSMDIEVRRSSKRDIVAAWYDSVCSALGGAPDGFSLDDAWNGYRCALGNMTVYGTVAGGGMDPSNERGKERVIDALALVRCGPRSRRRQLHPLTCDERSSVCTPPR